MNSDNDLLLLANNSKETIKIDSKSASKSELINDLKMDFESGELLIQDVNHNSLSLIVEYLKHYRDANPRNIESPISDDKELKDLTDEWDISFLSKIEEASLVELISAAEFMRVDPLHKLISAHIACKIRNMTAEQIVKFFQIEEDMTQEEMDKLEEEDNELLMKELAEEEEKEKKKWESEQK